MSNKKLLFIALAIGMMACNEANVVIKKSDYTIRYGSEPLYEVNIDGCQYLWGDWGNATVLTHKGNCNNPIHTHNGGSHE